MDNEEYNHHPEDSNGDTESDHIIDASAGGSLNVNANSDNEVGGEQPCTSISLPSVVNKNDVPIVPSDADEETPNSMKIINIPGDAVNNLSKCGDKVFIPKNFTLHNIDDRSGIPKTPTKLPVDQEEPLMKPDRTPVSNPERKFTSNLLSKLTQVLTKDAEQGDEQPAGFKSNLLDRLRQLHPTDNYNLLPSPENSETDGEMLDDNNASNGTILSVIEEDEYNVEATACEAEQSNECDIDLILSQIESEANPTPKRVSCFPCTKCVICSNIVAPIHLLAGTVTNMDKKSRCTALIKLWRDIKCVIKTKHHIVKIKCSDSNCNPCELCLAISVSYHDYVVSGNFKKRAKMREDFANIIKTLDPTTQVIMNSLPCSDKPKPPGLLQQIGNKIQKSSLFKRAVVEAISRNVAADPAVAYPIRGKRVENTPTKEQITSEFESPTESLSSDNYLDTSAGVTTIPIYETASTRDPSTEQSHSKAISDKMKNDLIWEINKAISKEVISLRKDLTSRILGTISPSISNTDLRSIESAIKNAPIIDNGKYFLSKSESKKGKNNPDLKIRSASNLAASLYTSPVLPVLPPRTNKINKTDLFKQLPVAEENKEGRKNCLLSNMNKAPPKNKFNHVRHVAKEADAKATKSIHFVTKMTMSSEDSASITQPAMPIGNSGHMHIKQKPIEEQKNRKIKVTVPKLKPRQRDNTLSNMTFPTHEEVLVPKNKLACAMDSINLNLHSRESSASSDTTCNPGNCESDGETRQASEDSLSKSYCCVCGHWEYDYEAETKYKDPGSISDTFQSEDNSDDSGGRTDFTAYTAVVPKKTLKKASMMSPPKKIKLDLPRSLTKNSSSTFLINKCSAKVSATYHRTSSPGSCTTTKNSKSSRHSKSRETAPKCNKISNLPKPKTMQLDIKKQSSFKSDPPSKCNIIEKKYLKKSTIRGTANTTPASCVVTETPIRRSSKSNSPCPNKGKELKAIKATTKLPTRNLRTAKEKHKNVDSKSKLPACVSGIQRVDMMPTTKLTKGASMSNTNTPPGKSQSKIGQLRAPLTSTPVKKQGVTKTSAPDQIISALPHPSSKLAKLNSSRTQSVNKSTISQTGMSIARPGIIHTPNASIPKPSTKKLSASHIRSSNTNRTDDFTMKSKVPLNQSVETTLNMSNSKISPGTKIRKFGSPNNIPTVAKPRVSSSLSRTGSVRKSFKESESKGSALIKQTNSGSKATNSSKSQAPALSNKSATNNSKQSSSFDSGIAISRTKSFRVTPVSKGVFRPSSKNNSSLHSRTPDSMIRSMGANSPAVSISFPKQRK